MNSEDQIKLGLNSNTDNTQDFICDLFKDENNTVDDGVFHFETDFLALKGNVDYLKLMKTLSVLEIQRIKICQNLEKLEQLKIRVEEDPEAVKSEILSGEGSYLYKFEVEKLPDIDWSKYKNIDFEKMKSLTTRRMAKNIKREPDQNADSKKDEKGVIRVRGRVFTENKPETYNQLWTVEEQLRLEQLLIEYPPEPVESRRWKKIADALGNRTTKQVCSRVQKYFKKLQKAGIAVPGRPKRHRSNKPAVIHRRHKHYLYRPTTFFPGVAMRELGESDSEEGGEGSGGSVEAPGFSHWIDILSQIKEEKENGGKPVVQHFGFKCQYCGEEPILGTRWSCKSCPQLSLCSDCLASLPESPRPLHPLSHCYQPHRVFRNPQYDTASLGSTSYLDPNFLPG